MAIRIDYREARDRHRLASSGIPTVLEVEEPPSCRPPVGVERSRRSHPENEFGQPALGRSAHSWGAVEARHSGVTGNSREVHGPAPEAAVADMAHLSDEPYADFGLRRFLRGSNHYIPGSVRLCDSFPRPPTSYSFCCDREPYGGMDRPATAGSLPL